MRKVNASLSNENDFNNIYDLKFKDEFYYIVLLLYSTFRDRSIDYMEIGSIAKRRFSSL